MFSDETKCPFCGAVDAAAKRVGAGPALVVGGALLAAAACGTSVDVQTTTAGVGGAGGAGTTTSASATSLASTRAAVSMTTSSLTTQRPYDAGFTDAQAQNELDGSATDASDAAPVCYGCDCPPVACIYRSPPRRSDWS